MEDTIIINSKLQQWQFFNCTVSGEISDSYLKMVRIYGGTFNPIFKDTYISEVNAYEIKKEKSKMYHIYKTLKKIYSEQGDDREGIKYFIKERELERKSSKFMKKIMLLSSKLYWGYGRKPSRIILISALLIFSFALIYYFLIPNSFGLTSRIPYLSFWDSLYISVVSFTTLGFGDVNPYGIARIFVAFESLFGAASIGFLVVGFSNFKY